jgi:CBS domain-containing protein
MFPAADPTPVRRMFRIARDCFEGRYPGYQAVDAQYHDLEHTLQGTLCLARLLHGRQRAGAVPAVTAHLFELGLLAILTHDTGYLKEVGDVEGTGAKYTLTHVTRSAEFARKLMLREGYDAAATEVVGQMIRCTGVNAGLSEIPFASTAERIVGYALGTADLLGQMAARDYVDKLPVLYEEFAEANRFESRTAGIVTSFGTATELMRKTPIFWTTYVCPKLADEFGGLVHFLNDPYPDGRNPYLDAIEANLDRLRQDFPA